VETVHEKIALWLEAALDGGRDPDETFTLRAVRPKILDWTEEDFQHADVIIEAGPIKTTDTTTADSRGELGEWLCSGIIRELPEDTAADTVVSRMIETIRRLLLAANVQGTACAGKAKKIDCPEAFFETFSGGLIAQVLVKVDYRTARHDGYE